MTQVLLSVVIPAYNRARVVTRAIRSVLHDCDVATEVIVVDDGSDDETETVVESLGDTRIRYMRVPHGGVSSARNAGASKARGQWLAFLDSDDEVLPGWSEAMLAAVERSGGVAMCGGEAIDPNGRELWTWTPPVPADPPSQELAEKFLAGMFVVGRDVFARVGGYVDQLAFGENTELALRLVFRDLVRVAVEPRVLVRIHVSANRDVYATSRIASAQYVIEAHPWVRDQLPALWASYHALIGVDAGRRRDWRRARHSFWSAALSRPLLEHFGRLAVSALPGVRSRVWTGAETVPSGALRVLLLVPEYPPGETGGIASYARELALGLAEVGHQVDVLVVRRDQRTEDVRDGPITVHRRPQVRLVPGRRLGGRFGRLGNASFVQRLEHALSCRTHSGRSGGPFDVVEICEWMAGGLFLSAQRTAVVLHVHGAAALVERRGAPSPAARISEMLETLAMRRCDLVTVPSSAMAERVRAQVGRRHRIRVVPCPTEVRGEVAPALGGPPAVLYVGRLDWLKAPEVLLQAGVLLREQVPDVEIRFVGRPSGRHDGVPYGKWLADLAEREKSPCLFLGERDRAEVLSAIAGSSVVAITSRFEAFGLSAAEALGQGRPVVCTDACGISYLVSPPAGLVVPFGDPYALADALLQFLPGGSLAAEAPGAALEVARHYLSRPVVAREKLACYREAIGS